MKECFIIGGGKSVRQGIETGLWDKIKGKDIYGINYAYKFMPYLPTAQVFIDGAFYNKNKEEMDKLAKQIPIYTYCSCEVKKGLSPCTMYAKSVGNKLSVAEMIQSNTLCVSNMGMSGEFAISLAIIKGYERIFLCGFDFGTKSVNDKDTHWYQYGFKNDEKVDRHTWWNNGKKLFSTGVGQPSVYFQVNKTKPISAQEIKLKKDLTYYEHYATLHPNIFNVSLDSNITAFPKISYEVMYKMLELEENKK
jgi:hypothetical protein